jgi:BirA family biotin operon repressor/biotin-[acetyl-CoA-carboxylase] ligase
MRIVKLNAIPSTNTFLKEKVMATNAQDFTVVVTNNQTQGKGQMGAVWESEPSKNLTFSVFKKFNDFSITNRFYITKAVSLAIHKALDTLKIMNLAIKWPNDILADNKKICGVLIENMLKGNNITGTIVGIGLNVNQVEFNALPKVTSLKKCNGVVYDLDEVLQLLLKELQVYFEMLTRNKFDELTQEYEALLYRKNKPSTFKDLNGKMFPGFIQGVTQEGKLLVLLEDEIVKEFDLKEIQLLY